MKKFFVVAALAGLGSAYAQVWNEQGDAGGLIGTAQTTLGSGNLAAISGATSATDAEDLYCIRLSSPGTFSATTTGGASFDTQLWLFAANGNGIAFDDDNPAGGLQSRLTSLFTANMAVGTLVYLGISGFDHDANNAGGLAIWADTPFGTERAPDGPGAPGPLAGWSGTGESGQYRIALTGATFCAVPEPSTIAALALGALALIRRRRSK